MRLALLIASALAPPFGVDPDDLGLPDLVVDGDVLRDSLALDSISNSDPCLLVEGCLLAAHPDGSPFVDATTRRRLLRFSTRVWNVGTADVLLGRAPAPDGAGPAPPGTDVAPWWEYSGCHRHYHLNGYAVHRLLRVDSKARVEQVGGSKTGFCARDNVCRRGAKPQFDCSHQGISVDCADHYGSELPCQWLDLSDVVDGRYTLEVVVNEARLIAESNYSNNVARVDFDTSELRSFNDPQTAGIVSASVFAGVLAIGVVVWLCAVARLGY